MSEKIGKLIAARVKAMGKKQAWLAESAGVSVNAVSKWMKSGKIARENVPRVAELLELSADELVSGEARTPLRQKSAGSKLERLDPDEAALLEMYRECGPGERELLIAHAKLLSGGKGSVVELLPGRHKP
jgi:transcriptional regulator with XRE-family HTH domain